MTAIFLLIPGLVFALAAAGMVWIRLAAAEYRHNWSIPQDVPGRLPAAVKRRSPMGRPVLRATSPTSTSNRRCWTRRCRRVLRMPLHADHPLVGEGELDPLDHAVVRPRHGLEVGAQLVDRLVVWEETAAPVAPSSRQPGSLLHPDLVRARAARHARHAMGHGAGCEVLLEGAAQRDVEHLVTGRSPASASPGRWRRASSSSKPSRRAMTP